jgi:hypothetical protein
MSREVACGRSRLGLRTGVADGPIAAKVVTHRPFLLLLVSGGISDEPTCQECPAGKSMKAMCFNGLIDMSQWWESVW